MMLLSQEDLRLLVDVCKGEEMRLQDQRHGEDTPDWLDRRLEEVADLRDRLKRQVRR